MSVLLWTRREVSVIKKNLWGGYYNIVIMGEEEFQLWIYLFEIARNISCVIRLFIYWYVFCLLLILMENHYLISALETLKECNFEFNKPIHILYLNLHLSMHKFPRVHKMKRLATYCNYIKYIYIYWIENIYENYPIGLIYHCPWVFNVVSI